MGKAAWPALVSVFGQASNCPVTCVCISTAKQRKLLVNAERLQQWLLRVAGATEILAFVAVVMPRAWMETSHEWLGLGEMVAGPVTMFVIRQASFSYGMHGIALWVLASDVVRFRPLIILNGIAFLIALPVFFAIDYTSGLPLWWAVGDSVVCGLFGVVLLLLTAQTRRPSPPSE